MAAESKDFPADFIKNTLMTFATPIVTHPWPGSDDLNRELAQVILEAEKHSTGISRSNMGGWHSAPGIFSWDAPCIKTLQERVHRGAVEMTRNSIIRRNAKFSVRYRLDGWANIQFLWYNMVGFPDSLFEVRYTIPTRAGLMVLFPSWLSHHVHPFVGKGERISIAFNILATKFRFLDDSEH